MGPRIAFARRARCLALVLVCAAAPVGAVACTWDVDYLAAGGDASAEAANDSASPSEDATSSDAGARPDAAVNDSGGAESGDVIAGSGNLIQNPGFEDGVTPWFTWNGPITAVQYPHSGSFSGYVSQRTMAYLGPVQDLTTVIVANHPYAGTAWIMWGVGTPPSTCVVGGCVGADGGSVGAADGGVDAAPPDEGGPGDAEIVDAEGGGADGPDVADAAGGRDAGDASAGDGSMGAEGGAPEAGDPSDGAADAFVVPAMEPVKMTAKVSCPSSGDSYLNIGVGTAPEWTWTQLSGSLTIPSCATGVQIYFEGPDPNIDMYVDDVSLTP